MRDGSLTNAHAFMKEGVLSLGIIDVNPEDFVGLCLITSTAIKQDYYSFRGQ